MLKENLYNKFQASDEYKQITQQLFDNESSGDKQKEVKNSE